MPRTADNIVRHELIGLPVEIVSATDQTLEDRSGTVVDETRQTLIVETDAGEITVPKETVTLRFTLESEAVDVDGQLLVGRPEERILKKFPRKWEYTD